MSDTSTPTSRPPSSPRGSDHVVDGTPNDDRDGTRADIRDGIQDGGAAVVPRAHDSGLDRLARRVLGLRDAEPRALMDLQGSLVLSAVRCLITYVAIPVLLPAIAWAGVVARPVGLVLAVLAVAMSIRSLRRVWQANWTYRWAYTAFVAVVVGLLCVSIVLDVRFFLT